MTVSDIDELRQKAREHQSRLWAAEKAERIRRTREQIGACYKYRNSYGSDERWWLYLRVIDVDENGWPLVFSFQTTSNDEIQIEPRRLKPNLCEGSYEPCPQQELSDAWAALRGRICNTLDPTIATPLQHPDKDAR